MLRQFGNEFGREIVSGEGGDVVEQHRKRGAVGHRAEEREHVDGLGHLALVEVRSADQGHVVAERGRVFGEAEGFDGGLDAGAATRTFSGAAASRDGFETLRRSWSESRMASPVETLYDDSAMGVRE